MYEINSISVLILKEILINNTILKKYIQETKKGKEYLIKNLNRLGFNHHKSYANLLLVNFKNQNFSPLVMRYSSCMKQSVFDLDWSDTSPEFSRGVNIPQYIIS